MTNPDVKQQRLTDIRAHMSAGVMAMMSDDTKESGSAEFETALKDYQAIKAMKSTDPKAAIANVSLAFPTTTINSVLEDIRTAHPLLDFIDFVNTTAVTKWLYNTEGEQAAVWGELTSAIVTELDGSIAKLDMTQCKLSAFFSIPNDILDLGPEWVDIYIRSTLIEAYAVGLEYGVVDGTGKNMPIGMTRDVSDDVVITAGEYPRKTAITGDFSEWQAENSRQTYPRCQPR